MSKVLLSAVTTAIQKHNLRDVSQLVNTIPVEKMDFINAMDLLALLIDISAKCGAPTNILEVILVRWFEVLEVEEIEQAIAIIAGTLSVSSESLKYVLKRFFSITPHEILRSNLTQVDLGVPFSLLYDRLTTACTASTTKYRLALGAIKDLLEVAKTHGRQDAIGYLEFQLTEVAPLAEVPEWVSILPIEQDLSPSILDISTWSTTSPVVTESSVAALQTIINSDLVLQDANFQPIDEVTLNQVVQMAAGVGSMEGSEMIVNGARVLPDRIFGPLNAIIDRECISGIPGGCRMLSCCCRDLDQGDDQEPEIGGPTSWFSGNCDACTLKISDLSHCVRYPTNFGGWVGCFCSVECIKACPPRDFDSLAELRLGAMVDTLTSQGIYDRSCNTKFGDVVPLPIPDL